MLLKPAVVARVFIGWIVVVATTLTVLLCKSPSRFYRFGPNHDLVIMGIHVDTGWKYTCVIMYSFINSMFRSVFHNYLQPWVTNNIQDESRGKSHIPRSLVYEIATVNVIYNWTDWLLYMNILLAQVDMLIIEVVADLVATYASVYYYTRPRHNDIEMIPLISHDKIDTRC